ncbi:CLUMA_CG009019, isoform A [Clunio marinus]|uniref:CLUMA_CG009019, isoform A n=1 Tax=Clunio marinus TaxID=568069 RepID=A0A1J1I730_9DIPT|nr:CLUMA_CG009019, isoform A [Clunio marinus]
MENYRYSIFFIFLAIISIVIGQKFVEQRKKLRFRPPSEWFENMQPSMEQSPNYFEQSDQPAPDIQFQDVYVDDFEAETDPQNGGLKVVRHPSMEVAHFQSLCPTRKTDVFLDNDSEYEYRPSSYEEAHIHMEEVNLCINAINCIQRNRTIFLTRRAFGTDCWKVETRVIPFGCECMWPKHHKGEILIHH